MPPILPLGEPHLHWVSSHSTLLTTLHEAYRTAPHVSWSGSRPTLGPSACRGLHLFPRVARSTGFVSTSIWGLRHESRSHCPVRNHRVRRLNHKSICVGVGLRREALGLSVASRTQTELSARVDAEGGLQCKASGLHPQQ
jgi:hypothetical protein